MRGYEAAGVDYDVLDRAKRVALMGAAATMSPRLDALGGALMASQGEPAFAFRGPNGTMASVLECLGTKSVLAREYMDAGGPSHFRDVGIDAVAAIVNDLICVGALPLVLHAYFATGAVEWYRDERRFADLVDGWREGCAQAGAVWGGGESPTLPGLVAAEDIELAGSGVGLVPGGRDAILGADLAPGDEIVLVASTGLHTNGSSLVRAVVGGAPGGYRARLPDGREWGASALTPSAIYVRLVAALLEPGGDAPAVTYLSHITGHGLRKLMRAGAELTYRIHTLPPVPPFLAALAEAAGLDDRAAYGTLNMGAGFAVYCRPGHGAAVVALARELGYAALVAGATEAGPRRVVLEPIGVSFDDRELRLRREG